MITAVDTSVPLHINEVFASGSGKQGEDGLPNGDWLELYNAGPAFHSTEGGWFLTDDREDLTKFELPAFELGEQQHLRIWCDAGEGEGIHASFRLSSKGEWLAVVRSLDGELAIVDSVHYAPRISRRASISRYPDGASTWETAAMPTPDAPNALMQPSAELTMLE